MSEQGEREAQGPEPPPVPENVERDLLAQAIREQAKTSQQMLKMFSMMTGMKGGKGFGKGSPTRRRSGGDRAEGEDSAGLPGLRRILVRPPPGSLSSNQRNP